MKTFRKKFIKKKPLRKASAKVQSAMEYLMTYGWAILIIAVVLAALFQLGVFNPMTFAPKAPPGSCQVFRPDGPGTTSFINLEGICSGELPQYVAQFNGQSSYINVASSLSLSPTTYISAFAWINPSSQSTAIIEKQGSYGMKIGVQGAAPGQFAGYVWGTNGVCSSYPFVLRPVNWYLVGFTFNGTTVNEYVNGKFYCSVSYTGSIPTSTSPVAFGGPSDVDGYIAGSIANVQIYNTSLSANEIQALYLEGIGGAPIDLQHLIAWWPLNGNANDYSGNGNNGQINNVTFVSNWYNGYTPP
ncbi:MAG: LamG domain-containing protein [Candidatus Micrarchaeota archaeon]